MGPAIQIWWVMCQICSIRQVAEFGIFGHRKLFPGECEISEWKIEWKKIKFLIYIYDSCSSGSLAPSKQQCYQMSIWHSQRQASDSQLVQLFVKKVDFELCFTGCNPSTYTNWNPLCWFHSLIFYAIKAYYITSFPRKNSASKSLCFFIPRRSW